jgi:ABC-type antimicrobial peptide transport system permease subunit
MNLSLKEGRWFDESIQSDHDQSLIINETYATKMGWENPLGEVIEIDSLDHTVIGVIKDFHYDGFYDPINPVMFRICSEDDIHYLTMKLAAGSLTTKEESIKATWHEIAPDSPFEGFFQDKVFEGFYNDNKSNVKLLGFIATVAVILACLGLFGLVSFNITRRMKEFSVRKVFGANTNQIFKLMNRDYVWILSIAFLIGAPSGFFLMNMLISHIYPEPQQAGPLPFAIAIGLMLLAVALTVGSQMQRVIHENPSNTLRTE